MLIILPPSETKRQPPRSGAPVDLEKLSFRELNATRARVLDALVETSGSPDAFDHLRVGPALVDDVLRNTDLLTIATRPAAEVYSGPLHAGFDWSSLTPEAKRRADHEVVIASALWGLLRPSDPIPAYRLHICASIHGIDRLEPTWRRVVPELLADLAGPSGVVLDLRSYSYQAMGRPSGLADRTVTLRVLPEAGARSIGDVVAKRVRGQIAHHLVESGAEPGTPDELVAALDDRWPARLDPPTPSNRAWTVAVRPLD